MSIKEQNTSKYVLFYTVLITIDSLSHGRKNYNYFVEKVLELMRVPYNYFKSIS